MAKTVKLCIIVCIILISSNSFAEDIFKSTGGLSGDDYDIGIVYVSERTGWPNSGIGYTLGWSKAVDSGYMRLDISSIKREKKEFGLTFSSHSIPIFMGYRFFLDNGNHVWGEIGGEISYDTFSDPCYNSSCGSGYVSTGEPSLQMNFGLPVGFGWKMLSFGDFYLEADLRYHIIKNSYYSGGIVIGVRL